MEVGSYNNLAQLKANFFSKITPPPPSSYLFRIGALHQSFTAWGAAVWKLMESAESDRLQALYINAFVEAVSRGGGTADGIDALLGEPFQPALNLCHIGLMYNRSVQKRLLTLAHLQPVVLYLYHTEPDLVL